MKTKRCKGCEEVLPLDAFYKQSKERRRTNPDLRQARCKECQMDLEYHNGRIKILRSHIAKYTAELAKLEAMDKPERRYRELYRKDTA